MNKVRLTRKELYDLVWSTSLLSLSRKYYVSDVGLRRICLEMDIPLPKAGHWEKVKAGKKVSILPLPGRTASEEAVELELRQEGAAIKKGPSLKNILQREIEGTLSAGCTDKARFGREKA
ncbi:hypothetical protein [Chitinophaga polysaccharea]|uniref:hypothetical protein n=1 Tax=Chitinophaga polysaccharea TaxID=1293035 RepID=UPI00115B826F|nr:hypothetical protein [Chitinophaga polysaccharea]